MNRGRKIAILGAGNVGSTIAYTLTMAGMASEIVLIDVNADKAHGEAMDILQGTPLCPPVSIHSGNYANAADADVVIITAGAARKPGQTRIDLAQGNVDIIDAIMPQIVKVAPEAVYVVVSNPVDVLTYAITKKYGLKESQVIGSGTMLDSARLRSNLAEHVNLSPEDVQGYVFGEHGDSSMIPWSLVTVGGMSMVDYWRQECERNPAFAQIGLNDIADDMRTAGSKVIKLKGATFYAVSLSVRRIVECVLRDTNSVLTVSCMINGSYGINDVCLSLPFVVGAGGIKRGIVPPMLDDEIEQLHASAAALKNVIGSIRI